MAETPLQKKAREKADEAAAAAADRSEREATDLAKAARENASKKKEIKDPDAPDPNDSPMVAASKAARRKAKAQGQAKALTEPVKEKP